MWVLIKQSLLVLRLERILWLLIFFVLLEVTAFITDVPLLFIEVVFVATAGLTTVTLIAILDDMRGMKDYLLHLQNQKHLEWREYVNGFLSPLREPLHEIMKPYARVIAANQDALKEMAFSSAELASNARDFSASAANQSAATTSSAAAITEMSYCLEDIALRIKSTRDMATEALQLTVKGSNALQEANNEVGQVAELAQDTERRIATLDEVMRSVTSMSRIISEISEQTNLLALNAAIEAARAGEYGRGFAVVADEVRGLAMRSQGSAAEISASITKVQANMQQVSMSMTSVLDKTSSCQISVRNADAAIKDISHRTHEVFQLVDAIAVAATQQSVAVREISGHVETVANHAQHNSERAGQAAEIAEHLHKLTRQAEC